MDYAVKEMKEFDPDSYAIEKKVLTLGNSNHFLSALCGEFSYKVCENRTPLDQLAELSNYPSVSRRAKSSSTRLV